MENTSDYKYDVFISSKSEDYPIAEEIYGFLKDKGLSVFLACKELQRIGESAYANAIDKALDSSAHMIVIASVLGYLDSKWVHYEWSTFCNDLKSGYRDGNLLTVLSDSIKLKTLPPSLRHHQSFRFDNYRKGILDYVTVHLKNNDDQTLRQRQSNLSTSVAIEKKKQKTKKTFAIVLSLCFLFVTAFVLFKFLFNSNTDNTIESFNDSIVDLGLPSKTIWSTRNLGATKTSDYGDLYAWGDIIPSTKQPKASHDMLDNIIGGINDAALMTLGNDWSIPSESQFAELICCCRWDWTMQDEHYGYLVTSKFNGNTIFLPVAGCIKRNGHEYIGEYGYYWTGECLPQELTFARELLICAESIRIESGKKNIPRSIRPVYQSKNTSNQ